MKSRGGGGEGGILGPSGAPGAGSLSTPEDQLPTVGRALGLTQTVSLRQLRVKGGPETPLPKQSGVCVPQEGLESAAQRSRERTDRPIDIGRGKGLPPAEGRQSRGAGEGAPSLTEAKSIRPPLSPPGQTSENGRPAPPSGSWLFHVKSSFGATCRYSCHRR